ncbi:hypothetical protein BJ138DRAFT_1103951 [Hygrophoropsis aurantiaca]|uniref:Uncharacterized protein n=1 Tax=Hygrophoropsis aurantiaca TaxID=72124 RepID=A0ACB8A3G3_9AGAM|nr:hypothetical protein BJ138DRAFT_1103951 [Hygrophoropsis aurantiaca]
MADPALIQELQARQFTNYVTVAAGALVVYDQVLTFSQEASESDNRSIPQLLTIPTQVDYIWNRQWSFTTALYLISRYSGSLYMIVSAAGCIYLNWTYSGVLRNINSYLNMMMADTWLQNIFVVTMQAILVIRVYALFNRSKKVLIFLATLYALQATATLALTALLYNNRALPEYIVSVGPAIGSVTQNVSTNSSTYAPFDQDGTFLPPVFDTIVLFFALWAFVRHVLEAKTLDGGWSVNVLVKTLVADHLVYFVCFQIWMTLAIAANYATHEPNTVILVGAFNFFTALVVVVGPRMVISLRAIENKTRGEGVILGGNLSTIRFAVHEPPT